LDLINVLKALSHENRIRILNLLRKKELCVCELENIMRVNQSNVSRHLNKLKQSELIKSKQEAQWVFYYLNEELIKKHMFINKIITDELDELKVCQEDNKRLINYDKSDLTCEDISKKNINLDKV